MKLERNQIIVQQEKIINYLLVAKAKNDKSNFLNQLGYTKENYQTLVNDIIELALNNEATLSRESEFGKLYEIKGNLKNSIVITVWMEELPNNHFRFVTLYPN